jgi:hypothetical protein
MDLNISYLRIYETIFSWKEKLDFIILFKFEMYLAELLMTITAFNARLSFSKNLQIQSCVFVWIVMYIEKQE